MKHQRINGRVSVICSKETCMGETTARPFSPFSRHNISTLRSDRASDSTCPLCLLWARQTTKVFGPLALFSIAGDDNAVHETRTMIVQLPHGQPDTYKIKHALSPRFSFNLCIRSSHRQASMEISNRATCDNGTLPVCEAVNLC